ncbi:MAG: hypothetical protein ACK40K_02245 [Raineya sp.]
MENREKINWLSGRSGFSQRPEIFESSLSEAEMNFIFTFSFHLYPTPRKQEISLNFHRHQ